MRLKDTGLTSQDIKDKVNKYMIETYERLISLQREQKICICTMKMVRNISTSMQESQ